MVVLRTNIVGQAVHSFAVAAFFRLSCLLSVTCLEKSMRAGEACNNWSLLPSSLFQQTLESVETYVHNML